jgi:uncharacterized protein YozE (UPF0346 family)
MVEFSEKLNDLTDISDIIREIRQYTELLGQFRNLFADIIDRMDQLKELGNLFQLDDKFFPGLGEGDVIDKIKGDGQIINDDGIKLVDEKFIGDSVGYNPSKKTLKIQDVELSWVGDLVITYNNKVSQHSIEGGSQGFIANNIVNEPMKLTFSAKIANETAEASYNKLLTYRDTKKVLNIIVDKEYKDMVFTAMSRNYDNIDVVDLELSFQQVTFAQIETTSTPVPEYEGTSGKEENQGIKQPLDWQGLQDRETTFKE